MHSHHSHSGDYVSHAVDSLVSVVNCAIEKGFTHFCLTEHMPRLNNKYLYPEEKEKNYTFEDLIEVFKKYLVHAYKLQQEHRLKGDIILLIGFEVEGVEELHIAYAKQLLKENPIINMCVGSVHHVHGIPIDFSAELWLQARSKTSNNTTRALYRDYFELQKKVINEIQPNVIGHFDLIRLFQPLDEIDPTTKKHITEIDLKEDWPEVWELVIENIEKVNSYGGLFELNSSAIRKGWKTPYPQKDFALTIKELGGKFCLSDDSHGTKQVGLNYHKVWDYVKELELDSVYYLDLDNNNSAIVKEFEVSSNDNSPFWNSYY